MKKFVYTAILFIFALTTLAQVPKLQSTSLFQQAATFAWNTTNGLPYVQSFSGNYSIEVYRYPDKNHIAFLSRTKQSIYLFNSLTGKKEKTFHLSFSPVDFAVSNGKYYVAGTQNLYLLDQNGKTVEEWPFRNKLLYVDNIKVLNNKVYLFTASQKTWIFDPVQQRFSLRDGIMLGNDWYGKILKTGTHQFRIFLNGKGETSYEKTFSTAKELGTVRLIGMKKSLLFVEIQTILNEYPLKVKRDIVAYHWQNGKFTIASSLVLPDVYYTYTKHDITLQDGQLNVFISSPKAASLYHFSSWNNLKSGQILRLPQYLYEASYHYNDHLLPAMEGGPAHTLKQAQLTPITRQKIIQNAEPYATHKWYCHAYNIWDRDCGGVHVKTPDWVQVGDNISVPYMWGGFSSVKQFDQGLINGVSAGDCDTHGNGAGSSCAVGVDCSGFVSRAWGLGTKYCTRCIPDISTQYSSYNSLKPGDVVNYAGHHVRLIHTVNGNGSFLIIEAAASSTNWRVGYSSYTVADFEGRYLPRHYNKVVEGQPDKTPPTTSIHANKWETSDFQVGFTDKDNIGVTHRFYHVGYLDGTQWTANSNDGFFKDHFGTGISPQWTKVSGTWALNNGTLVQSDESNANTNLYASATQNAEAYNFLYEWKMKIEGSGDNRRAGIHFMADKPSYSQRHNSYLVYFRVDQNTCQIYKCENNSIHLKTSDACTVNAGEWFDAKVMYNAKTGEIAVFKNNKLVSLWIDTEPLTHGNSISLRTGNASVSYQNLTLFRSRGIAGKVTVGKDADVPVENKTPGQPACRIFSIVADSMYNFSATDTAFVNIDTTKPADFKVSDGTGSDVDSTEETTQISANWTPSSDPNSGIAKYFCCVGTLPKSGDAVDWFDNGNNTSFTKTGLNLTAGKTYYVSVVGVNGAGLVSDTMVSDGIKVGQPTGIPNSKAKSLTVYPVPATTAVWIKTPESTIQDTPALFDLTGKKLEVRVTKHANGLWKISLNNVPQGLYLIRVITQQGPLSKKIMVRK